MLKKVSPYLLILLFLLAVLPQFSNPINGLDAAWNFSNAVNLSGDFFNHYTNNIVSNLYCYTQSFIAFGISNQYGSVVFHSLILLGFLLLIYGELGFSNKAFFLGLIIISSYYFKLHRSEHVTLLLGIILYQSGFKSYDTFTRISITSVLVFILHPVHGLFTFVGLLAYEQSIWKYKFKIAAITLIAFICIVAIHILIPENTYSNSLLTRIENIGFAPITTFIKHGTITLLALVLLTYKNWNLKFGLHLLTLLVLITIFGTANYFVYLYLPLILVTINEKNTVLFQPILIGLIALSSIINIIHPVFVQFENPSYAQTGKAILLENNKRAANHNSKSKVFSENYYAAPLFKNSQSRMILVDKQQVLLVDSVSSGDVILSYFKSKPQKIISHLEQNYPTLNFHIKEVVAENQGYLTLSSLYKKRTEPIGLWLIDVK